MDGRLVLVLGLLAATAAPLASAQLAADFYKTSCPDAEKIIAAVMEKKFKEDPATASAGLLRLFFHDCFANGCDASILVDALSNQSAEKEAGPNMSVRGFFVIDEVKKEVEAKCPGVVSCADVLALSTREGIKLAGGPAYELGLGRRDSVVSNREDADDNLPGPDMPVPKAMSQFMDRGFTPEEMVALMAGGHSIGRVLCMFVEFDASPMDPEYHKSVTKICDDTNETAFVSMDELTPSVVDNSYFKLARARRMPLTIDRLMALDKKTLPIIKNLSTKTVAEFLPMFGKAMTKLSTIKVITGKEGEVRTLCGDFVKPQDNSGAPSVTRPNSVDPTEMENLASGGKPVEKHAPAAAPAQPDEDDDDAPSPAPAQTNGDAAAPAPPPAKGLRGTLHQQ